MKITIITATYNSGATLRDTIKSVLGQTYLDYEHIIVDGKSKDATLDIIREYEPHYQGKLRWISEPDKGIYDAMNKGIRMATGDIVGLLNSDDFYTSNDVLEHVAKALSDSNVDAIYGDIHYVNDDDLTHCVRYYSSRVFSRGLMRLGFMPAHPSFYCRRTIYEKYGLFDTSLRVAADFENLLRLIFVNRIRTKYIPEDFVTMRTGGASSSGIVSHKRILKEHMVAYKQNGVYSNLFLEGLRYLYKIEEILVSKLSYH
ncbi:glycosyltransferase family 2 protein [uncultured Alistipes sp.]|uniref:glycosyltransferase family 2 protein n=1 Tax=uncultured Alistipes sp. TaxID=538949 RepID=UPI00266CAC96|nr:glycosyltransferase family 2 protein [uncultured Alistipes sp.]